MTKLAALKDAAARGDWRHAVAIAARFQQLGAHRSAILDAHGAWTNPRFAAQIGKDPEALKRAGEAALRERYGIA